MNDYVLKNINWMSKDSVKLVLSPKDPSFKMQFFPGQYIALGFKKSGRPSPVRCFSIASSPNEIDISVGMRVTGSFTKTISKLNVGDKIFVYGPFGNFVIDEEADTNIIMFAGGIGITPYMSMLNYLLEEGLKVPVTLIFGVRSTENIPFYNELSELEAKNKSLRILYVVADNIGPNLNPNKFIKGFVGGDLIDNITAKNYNPYTYFICGPKGFKDNIIGLLEKRNVLIRNIITEEFTPSTQLNTDAEQEKMHIPKYTYLASALTFGLGTLFFMAIDLVRFVPKITNAQTTSVPINQSDNTSTTPIVTPTTDNSSQSNGQNSTVTTPQQNTTTTTPQQNNYQAPTTHAS
jgi:hypothetical protein